MFKHYLYVPILKIIDEAWLWYRGTEVNKTNNLVKLSKYLMLLGRKQKHMHLLQKTPISY